MVMYPWCSFPVKTKKIASRNDDGPATNLPALGEATSTGTLGFDRHHRAAGFEDDELSGGPKEEFLGTGFLLDPHEDKVDGIVGGKLDDVFTG
jgi:hypothetical protein